MSVLTISGVSASLAVASGTTVEVVAGGTTDAFSLAAGAFQFVSSGGSSLALVISSGAGETVFSGGYDSGATVLSGGVQTVASGGVASGTQVQHLGTVDVAAGGVLISGVARGGGELSISGRTEALVDSGSVVTVHAGGTADGTTLAAGGQMTVFGLASGTQAGAGNVYVSAGGTFEATTTEFGAVVQLLSGGSASGAVFQSGAELYVSGGASLASTVVSAGGLLVFAAGATLAKITVAAGAEVQADGLLLSGSGVSMTAAAISAAVSDASFTGSGPLTWATWVSSAHVEAGAVLSVGHGGRSLGNTVSGGGLVVVAGVASDDIIAAGGSESIGSNGIDDFVAVASGGTLVLNTGGAITDGTLSVGATFVAIGETLGAGRSLTVAPLGATDHSLNVGAAGPTSDVTIASDTTLTGGTLTVASGGLLAGTLDFAGSGSELVLDGTGTPGAALSGFGSGDTIDFSGLAFDSGNASASFAGDTITVHDGGTVLTLHVAAGASYPSGALLVASDNSGGTELLACFCPGTRIATPGGAVAVEDLCVGDLVMTQDGPLPVRFLGVQTVATRFADPLTAWPVRIRAGALGEGLPARDLRLSPGHALFLDGLLVQAGALVDGVTVLRETVTDEIFEYYHVELDRHALLLAEGVPAESFLDLAEPVRFDNAAARPALPQAAELPYPRVKSARQLPPRLRGRAAA